MGMHRGQYQIMNSQNKRRGLDFCRACESTEIFVAYDLGYLPIANELHSMASASYEEYPLTLSVCRTCTLGQVQDVVTPERLFQDYRYTSSTSTTFLNHAKTFVNRVVIEMELTEQDWVLEIASNDGYLLRNFLPMGINVIGIEPSINIGKIASESGVQTITEFFSSNLAEKILNQQGYPKLIIANNVLAHVPDIRDFMLGLSILCGKQTVISIENPSLLNILKLNQFDSIYHEHFSYLTANSVSFLAESFGLNLFHVESIPTHGGSNRYWVGRSSHVSQQTTDLIRFEENALIRQPDKWVSSFSEVRKTVQEFADWLDACNREGGRVVGYGAAAKASTLLNLAKVGPDLLPLIADKSSQKRGRYMPSGSIPIVDLTELIAFNPSDIVIFPWNIASEIHIDLKDTISESRFWKAIPAMMRL